MFYVEGDVIGVLMVVVFGIGVDVFMGVGGILEGVIVVVVVKVLGGGM